MKNSSTISAVAKCSYGRTTHSSDISRSSLRSEFQRWSSYPSSRPEKDYVLLL